MSSKLKESSSDSNHEDIRKDGCNFKFSKLLFDVKVSQLERREGILRWQKERRDDFVTKIRQLENDSFTDDEDAVEMTVDESENVSRFRFKDKNYTKNKKYWAFGAKIMRSEWLVDKPEDIEESWLGVFCPTGARCLVFASKGKTRVISRRGILVGTMNSELPGGSNSGNYGGPAKGTTILDCIWCEGAETFYVLDMLCWNSMVSTNFETECRTSMMRSNIEDIPALGHRSTSNEFRFVPLNFFSGEYLQRELRNSDPPFSEQVDGLLIFHKESLYIYEGSNPLCLWIELKDVSEMLHLEINEELLDKARSTDTKKFKGLKQKANVMDT